MPAQASDNRLVSEAAATENRVPRGPFCPGTVVVVTLGNPREKLWGMILAIRPEGLSLCGVELASFDDLVAMVKDGEPFSPGVVFFPMHRLERIELDRADGNIPSLAQRFTAKTGRQPSEVLVAGDSEPFSATEEQR
jgi:hypothetical protein